MQKSPQNGVFNSEITCISIFNFFIYIKVSREYFYMTYSVSLGIPPEIKGLCQILSVNIFVFPK